MLKRIKLTAKTVINWLPYFSAGRAGKHNTGIEFRWLCFECRIYLRRELKLAYPRDTEGRQFDRHFFPERLAHLTKWQRVWRLIEDACSAEQARYFRLEVYDPLRHRLKAAA